MSSQNNKELISINHYHKIKSVDFYFQLLDSLKFAHIEAANIQPLKFKESENEKD